MFDLQYRIRLWFTIVKFWYFGLFDSMENFDTLVCMHKKLSFWISMNTSADYRWSFWNFDFTNWIIGSLFKQKLEIYFHSKGLIFWLCMRRNFDFLNKLQLNTCIFKQNYGNFNLSYKNSDELIYWTKYLDTI
jgi:hypothetical protein